MIRQFFLIRPPAAGLHVFEEDAWFSSKALPIPAEVVVVIQQATRWIGDAFILVLGIVLALSVGLTTLYFGKIFGTWENYLAAILLALATPTTLKFLTDALKQFGSPTKS